MKTKSLAVLLSLTLPVAASAAELGKRLDAEITTSAGTKTKLKAYYGKPVLLFYEDPDSVKLNQAAKEELAQLNIKWNLKDKVDVVAIANLQGWNWQPALFFALLVVRGEEEKAKIPVLVDLNGSMQKAPWSLSAAKSSVLVLAPDGEVLFQSVGLLKGEKLEELKSTLEKVLTSTATAQKQALVPATEAVALNGGVR
jgi:hypothetical protein